MQRIAYRLALIAALPLFYLTLATLFSLRCPVPPVAGLLWLMALLLSLFGGMEFGAAMRHPGDDILSRWVFGISLFPMLAGFIALAAGGSAGLWVAAGGHLSVYAVDWMLERVEMLPVWFRRLRLWITLGVLGCIALALIGEALR